MKIKDTVGIDVSKLTLDVRIHSNQMFEVFENSNKGFKKMIQWTYRNSSFLRKEIFFVFEHTGLYSEELSVFLSKQKILFALVPGLEIKRSLGIARGKDDKIDATKIALYGYRLKEELQPYQMPSDEIKTLKSLLSLRERIVKQRAGYKASLKEQKRVLKKSKCLFEIQQKMIEYGTKQILRIEKQIEGIIKKDEPLKHIYQLITSIKGVGPQTALFMIIITNGFTKFKNARKFASYCGIAPFPNRSGTSIRGKTKVSHLANKKMKSLLDLCAKVSIQHNAEMKKYYQARLAIGKNKMSTINIIRNKIVSRIFAVVDRKTPYVNFMKYAA